MQDKTQNHMVGAFQLNEFKNYDTKDEPNKQKILNIAGTIEDLSIKNEYKLNLIKEFPEYFSNIRSKK